MNERKIPTLLGLILIVGILIAVVTIVEQFFRMPSEASGSNEPKNTAFSNISDASFTVTWTTPESSTGIVTISSKGNSTVAYDERDMNGKMGTYATHSVTVLNLLPNTQYAVKILSNGKTYNGNDKALIATTAPSLSEPLTGFEPAYGTILALDGQPANGALVFLTLDNGQTLSSLVTQTGSWVIPLNAARTVDLTHYVKKQERIMETIHVIFGSDETTAMSDTLNDSPVPEITIGKNYDFRHLQAKKETMLAENNTEPPAVLGAQTGMLYRVALISPGDGASLPTDLPLIEGTGIPGKLVSLTLGVTEPVPGSTKVSGDGTWQFTPSSVLKTGQQSVTITTEDSKNHPVAITHTFTLLKSGSQVLGDATPSATLIPTPMTTPIATPTAQPIPTSGTTLPTVLFLSFGLLILSGGFLLAL